MPDKQCLLDAGMSKEEAWLVIARMKAGENREAALLLKNWRGELLNRLHGCEKQIDCLDYFLRQNKEELQ